MASKIKDTPILYGIDAWRFEREIKANDKKAVSKDEYERAMAAFKKFKGGLQDE